MSDTLVSALITVAASIIVSIITGALTGRRAAIKESNGRADRLTKLEGDMKTVQRDHDARLRENERLRELITNVGNSMSGLKSSVDHLLEEIKEIKRHYASKDSVNQLSELLRDQIRNK